MNIKIIASIVVIFSLYFLIFWLSRKVVNDSKDFPINIGLIILGGAVGWLVGIFLTPYGEGQKAEFAEYASAIALFCSGYLVGKVDAAITHLLKPENLFTPLVGFRIIITFSSFLLSMIITAVIRYYV